MSAHGIMFIKTQYNAYLWRIHLTVQHRNRLFLVTVLAVALLVATATFAVVEAVSNGKGVSNQGKSEAVNLGLYWDNACTNTTSAVDWGLLSPGAASNVTFYVRNEESSTVKLNLTTQNWNPANASEYITLTWNREGQVFEPQSVAIATLTLSVSANISGITNFSFDTIVTGVGQ
jgi:hypothetical protein